MPAVEIASHTRPCLGETVCGDAVVVREVQSGWFLGIIDVLGHGPDAHELAVTAAAYLHEHAGVDVARLMTDLHAFLKGTRGAAAGLAFVDAEAGRLCYAGTGNTVLRKFGGREARLVSRDGVLGQNMTRPLPQELALEAGDVVLLYTDGVRSHFARDDYQQLPLDAARRVAREVVRRFGKDHDDAACIALRYQA